jgi:hypothetical protein
MVGTRIGLYVGIETKAEGQKATPRQLLIMDEIRKAGGVVFLIDRPTQEISQWLCSLRPSEIDPTTPPI